MKRHRSIALLVIGSLLNNPLSAAGLAVAYIRPSRPPALTLVEQEALAVKPLMALRDIGKPLRSRRLLASFVLGVLAHQTLPLFSESSFNAAAMISLRMPSKLEIALAITSFLFSHIRKKSDQPVLQTLLGERDLVLDFHMKAPRAVVVFGSARIPEGDPVYKQGMELGRAMFKAGLIPRTGAGPGIMEAVVRGYIEARNDAGVEPNESNQTQGTRIALRFEQFTNIFIEMLPKEFTHFITRKLSLHNNMKGAIAMAGGIGTLDEMFEVWQRGRPLVLLEPTEGPFVGMWTRILDEFDKVRALNHLTDPLPTRPLITSSLEEAIAHIQTAPSKGHPSPPVSWKTADAQLAQGFIKLSNGGPAVVMIGRPLRHSAPFEVGRKLMTWLLETGGTLRIGTRRRLEQMLPARNGGKSRQRQAVLFIPPGQKLRPKERHGFGPVVVTQDPSVHQVLLWKKAEAFVFFPGGVGTLNRLFDIIQLMQTGKLDKKKIILVGNLFWKPLMEVIFKILLTPVPILQPTDSKTEYSLVTSGDEKLLHFVDTFEEGQNQLILGRIQSRQTSNLHVHGSGGLSYAQIAKIAARYRDAIRLPSAPPGFDPTREEDWQRLSYKGPIQSGQSFESIFYLAKELIGLTQDFALIRDWYKELVLTAQEQGNRFVAITSTFDQFKDEPEVFKQAILAAAEGLLEGEKASDDRTRGVLIFAVRKSYSAEESSILVDRWLALKKELFASRPELAERLFGVDWIEYETRTSDFGRVKEPFTRAAEQGQWVKAHVGEMWAPGQLMEALQRIKTVVDSGLVRQITNPIALFVDPKTVRPDLYPQMDPQAIQALQESILKEIRRRKIIIEVSPTSNEQISQDTRTAEGWAFTPIAKMLDRGLWIVVTDDDPGHFNTQFAEEHLRVYQGRTIYGPVSLNGLKHLLHNSEHLTEVLHRRHPQLNILPAKISRPAAQMVFGMAFGVLMAGESLPAYIGPVLIASLTSVVIGIGINFGFPKEFRVMRSRVLAAA